MNVLLERAAAAETAGDAELAGRFLDQASDLAPDYAETLEPARQSRLPSGRLSRRHRRDPGNAEARATPFRRARRAWA